MRGENPELSSEMSKNDKPPFAMMVEAYEKLSADPEKAAFDALYSRLDPKLSEEEKMDKMRELGEEYRRYKETLN